MQQSFIMKIRSLAIITIALGLAVTSAEAQFGTQGGGGAGGMRFNGAMAKLFGENGNFSANLEMEMKGGALSDTIKMPGKMAVADGKSRFEMDATQIKGGNIPESALAQMKAMGMDKMIMISRPDKKVSYMVYPNLQSYAESPMSQKDASEKDTDFKIETSELGKETIDGHPCVKTKVTLTDDKGGKQEATLWNASDLKKFPVKLERTENNVMMTMLFKDVKLSKPDAAEFDPPAGLTKYDSPQALMQGAMMKKFGGAGAGAGAGSGKQEQ
jgi:hypothetical protein